jgi:hypothetical protein
VLSLLYHPHIAYLGRPCHSLCNPVPYLLPVDTLVLCLIMSNNPLPLVSFEPGSLPPIRGRNADDYDTDDEDDRPGNPRRWYHYVPLCS